MMTLPLPAAPAGTVQEQAAQQYSYLVQMAQQLNLALGQLEELGSGAGAESARRQAGATASRHRRRRGRQRSSTTRCGA